MEASPLTRQPQPEVFTPKIIHLYDSLFKVCLLQHPLVTANLTCCPSRFAMPAFSSPSTPLIEELLPG